MALPAIEHWRTLALPESAPLIAAAEQAPPGDAAALERLRRGRDHELVRAALLLAEARRKARAKWPESTVVRLIADPAGVEMMTSSLSAAHKARRFAALLGPRATVADLCSGVGGDAIGLAAAGLEPVTVDRDPVRAWMAGHNASCPSLCADVLSPDIPPGPFHLDPARRSETADARRTWRLEDHQPGPDTWRELLLRRGSLGAAIKLGPGLDIVAALRLLPDAADAPVEVEILSQRGRLTQAVLWIGPLSRGRHLRTATLLLDDQHAVTLSAGPHELDTPAGPDAGPLRRLLIEADASLERAGLLSAACRAIPGMTGLHPGLGLLTADQPPAGPLAPMFTSFEVLARMPWIEKHARTFLRDHNAGIVEIKTRARAVDPDALQVRLRGRGDQPFTIFVLRLGRELHAIMTRRLPRPEAAPTAPAPPL